MHAARTGGTGDILYRLNMEFVQFSHALEGRGRREIGDEGIEYLDDKEETAL